MSVIYKTGDIFSTDLTAIGHGVNVYGLMGAGIAKIVADRYPNVLLPYQQACKDKSLVPGGAQFVEVEDGFFILNLASQDKPGPYARLEWLESSLSSAVSFCEQEGLAGFAIPRIGAGIGGLDWDAVQEVINALGKDSNVLIEVWSLPGA